MNTANKLAQIAQANQHKQKDVDVYKNGKIVFTGSYLAAEAFMNKEGGVFTMKPAKNHQLAFEKKVKWQSHQYVRFVIKRCTELASLGYGSVEITIDRTTDLSGIDENRNSCYSLDFVCDLLKDKGFEFDKSMDTDHYDAISTILVWDNTLQLAPHNMEIGMCWE